MGHGTARHALLVGALAMGMLGCGKKDQAQDAPAAEAKGAPAEGAAAGGEGKAAAEGAAQGEAKAEAKGDRAPPPAPTGTVPAVMGTLTAEFTVAVGGFEGLDEMARVLATTMEGLPAELKTEMQEELPQGFDSIVTRLGFDPRDAQAWKSSVGIDPAAGITVVLDTRLKSEEGDPWPIVMARVFDRGKVIETLKKAKAGFELGLPGTDGVAELTAPGGKGLVGTRGDYTALLPLMQGQDEAQAKAARAAFSTWLQGGGESLGEVAQLAPALKLPGKARSYALVLTRPLLALVAGELAPVFANFYPDRFPAMSLAVTTDMKQGSLRILGDEAAVVALRKILVPAGPAPDLDRFAPEDGIVMGFTFDPIDFFDGVVALIPPERGDLQGQVLIGKNAVPVALGVSLDDLGKALSGHVVVTLPADGVTVQNSQKVVVALGVADGEVLDRVLTTVFDRLAGQAGGKRSPTKFGELEGHLLEGNGPPTFAVRAGDALLLGPGRAAIEAALARQGKPGGPQLDLSDGVFYGASFSLALLEKAMADTPPEAAAMVDAARDFWKSRVGEGFSMGLRVDEHGIRSDGVGATLMLGMTAAVAIPAFMKYIRRSKAAMARIALNQLFMKATLARMEQRPLEAAPLTPAADPCANGGDGSYEATPETWKHPAWRALGFAPTGKQYYRFAFEPGEGQGFTVRAVGDLNCDGVLAEYVHGNDADGQRVPDIERNPLE